MGLLSNAARNMSIQTHAAASLERDHAWWKQCVRKEQFAQSARFDLDLILLRAAFTGQLQEPDDYWARAYRPRPAQRPERAAGQRRAKKGAHLSPAAKSAWSSEIRDGVSVQSEAHAEHKKQDG